jgi:hypothetical protein
MNTVSLSAVMIALIALAPVAGCGGDPQGPGDRSISVALTVIPSPALPGEPVRVVINANPNGVDVESFVVTTTGLVEGVETLLVYASGPVEMSSWWDLPWDPPEGTVEFHVEAEGGGVTGTAEALLEVKDELPPDISALRSLPENVATAGSGLSFQVGANDNAGIRKISWAWEGATAGVDSSVFEPVKEVARSIVISIPAAAALGDSIVMRAGAIDVAGNESVAEKTLRIGDTAEPTASVEVGPYSPFVPGDTALLTVHGSDDHSLAWVGYELEGPAGHRDSARVQGAEASHEFRLEVVPEWVGTSRIRPFARDEWENRGTPFLPQPDFAVVDAERDPIRIVDVGGSVHDLAYDPVRERVYVSLTSEQRIVAVSLADATVERTWDVPGYPRGLDLTRGGDTLAVGLSDLVNGQTLALIDLVGGGVSTTRFDFPPGESAGAYDLRVLSNGKLIAILHTEVWEFDLATNVSRQRTEVGTNGGQIPAPSPLAQSLARSHDREILLVYLGGSCCPFRAHLYEAARDVFTPAIDIPGEEYQASPSTDATGTRFLISRQLFDAGLSLLAELAPFGIETSSPTALTPDAGSAYIATRFGYVEVATADRGVIREAVLPGQPERLWVLPDDATMVAAWGTSLGMVNLAP